MPINYNTAMYSNPMDEDAPKKTYAKSQYTNILALDKFAQHIASHSSEYNRANIYAVLMQTVDCMRKTLLEGKRQHRTRRRYCDPAVPSGKSKKRLRMMGICRFKGNFFLLSCWKCGKYTLFLLKTKN